MASIFREKKTQPTGDSKLPEMNYSIKFTVTVKGLENVELNDGTGFRKSKFISEPIAEGKTDEFNNLGFSAVETKPSIIETK